MCCIKISADKTIRTKLQFSEFKPQNPTTDYILRLHYFGIILGHWLY